MIGKTQNLIEAPSDSNYQCEGQLKEGAQCRFLSIPGLVVEGHLEVEHSFNKIAHIKTCPKHGGNLALKQLEKKIVHSYRLKEWAQRLDEFAEDEQVKTLRGEIGVLRLVLEQTLNKCETNTELILYSSKISDLVTKIEKTVVSADKLEQRLGLVMDRTQALMFVGNIINILQKHIQDPAKIEAVSNEMITSLGEQTCLASTTQS